MSRNKTILVTGGAGYIGTHTCVELVNSGCRTVVIDNYSNSSHLAVRAVEEITHSAIRVYDDDIRDRSALRRIFKDYAIDAIIHLSGLKAVGESVVKPLEYYDNNVVGSIVLFEEAQKSGCRNILFSSSATVYGRPQKLPIAEDTPVGDATNPYGASKMIIENILQDICKSEDQWKVGLLRYFNPVGAHVSGKIGERPNGTPNNLMPRVAQVAVGKLSKLEVFGGDYATPDGTAVRDYIHVEDLSKGHVSALSYLLSRAKSEVLTVNLGTGVGHSVLEVIDNFAEASGKEIPYEIVSRRKGDIAACFADVGKAKQVLGWHARLGIDRMCLDAWRFANRTAE